MNLPGIDWQTADLKPNCMMPFQHNQYLEPINNNEMTQIIEEPTRLENTLELIVVSNPTLVNRTEILPGISDHDGHFVEIDISPKRY